MRIIVYGGVCTSEMYPTDPSIALYRVFGSGDSEVALRADVLGRTRVLFDVTSHLPGRVEGRQMQASILP